MELSPQIPWTADAQGRITEAGPRWIKLTGMTPAQTLGHGWSKALHPDDLQATVARWTRALEERHPLDIEYRVRLQSGVYRWFRAYAAPRLAADGSVVRWYGTLKDIHDRRSTEEALRRSEAFARTRTHRREAAPERDSVILSLPRDLLTGALPDLDGLHGRVLYDGPGALMRDHMLTLASQAGTLRRAAAADVVRVTAHMLAACLDPTAERVARARGPLRHTLVRRATDDG